MKAAHLTFADLPRSVLAIPQLMRQPASALASAADCAVTGHFDAPENNSRIPRGSVDPCGWPVSAHEKTLQFPVEVVARSCAPQRNLSDSIAAAPLGGKIILEAA